MQVKSLGRTPWQRLLGFIGAHPVLVSAGLVLLAMAGSAWLVNPRFLMVDDWRIAQLLQGQAAEGSPFIYFINIVLGALIWWLYRITPGWPVEWFAAYQVALLYITFTVVAWLVLTSGKKPARFAVLFLFLMGLVPYYTINLQFTTTTCVAELAGLLLLYRLCRQKARPLACLSAALLMVAAFVLRAQSALMALPFFLLVVVDDLIACLRKHSLRETWAKWKRPVAWLCGTMLVLALLHVANALAWAGYDADSLRFSAARRDFLDYPTYDPLEISEGLDAIDMSKNTYELIRRWYFADPVNITTETFAELKDLQPEPSLGNGLAMLLSQHAANLIHNSVLITGAVAAVLTGLLALRIHRGWLYTLLSLLSMAGAGAVFLLFCTLGRLTQPVINGVLFLAVVPCLLFLTTALNEAPAPKRAATGLVALGLSLAVVLGVTVVNLLPVYRSPQHMPQNLRLYETLSQRKDSIFFVSGIRLPDPGNVLVRNQKGLLHNVVPLGSWITNHPTTFDQYQQLGITAPLRNLDREDAFVLTTTPDQLDRLVVYNLEMDNRMLAWSAVDQVEDRPVYKFTAADRLVGADTTGIPLVSATLEESETLSELQTLSVELPQAMREEDGTWYVELDSPDGHRVLACYGDPGADGTIRVVARMEDIAASPEAVHLRAAVVRDGELAATAWTPLPDLLAA